MFESSGSVPQTVLVAALLMPHGVPQDEFLRGLVTIWGDIVFRSDCLPFSFTRYYEKEMGGDLVRQFVAFGRLLPPEQLCQAKLSSISLEKRFSRDGRRTVNIDPGYLDLSKLIVASTKDATYRVYLGDGIYAQAMLRYERNSFCPWPWAYPDYKTDTALAFFNRVRNSFKETKGG
jgi:hypothetical protein